MPQQPILIVTPAAQDLFKATRRVLDALRPFGQDLPAETKQIIADAEGVYRRVDRSALPPDLSHALEYAIASLRARRRGEVYRDLAQDARELLNHYTLAKPKKARRESTQESHVSPQRLERFKKNFKAAQLSLDLSRPTNDRGWVQQKQPTKPMKIITGPDDRPFHLWLSEEDRERIEKRDAKAIRDWAEGYRPPCPITRYVVTPSGRESFEVVGFVQDDRGDWDEVGSLLATKDDEAGGYVSGSAGVPIPTLAACPGLGNGLYLAAANEACRRKSRLVGSSYRSIFSEHFWKKQIEKGRATCSGGAAGIYSSPARRLREALDDGEITVPQYNAMRARLPEFPDDGEWECQNVALNPKWCKTPKKDRTLRGVKARGGRYRLTSGRG